MEDLQYTALNAQSDTNIDKFEPKVAHNSKQITLDNRPGRLLHNWTVINVFDRGTRRIVISAFLSL